jgi:hypothetical protein
MPGREWDGMGWRSEAQWRGEGGREGSSEGRREIEVGQIARKPAIATKLNIST